MADAARALHAEVRRFVRNFGGSDWVVLDAVPCVLAKLRGSFRWHIVVKCPTDHDVSRALLPLFRARKADARVNVAVDVDPEDLL